MKAAVVRTTDQEVPRYETFELPAGEGPVVNVLAAGLSPRVRSGAAGKHYTTTWFDMLRITDGKVAEHWDSAMKGAPGPVAAKAAPAKGKSKGK